MPPKQGRIIKMVNFLAGKKDGPDDKQVASAVSRRRNGNGNGNGKKSAGSIQETDARTVVVQQGGADPQLLQIVSTLTNQMRSMQEKMEQNDLIGKEGKRDLAMAVMKPVPGTERRMTRISRRSCNLLAADETFDFLLMEDDDWPLDSRGNPIPPGQLWRESYTNYAVSIQGHQFDKISNLAGLQSPDDNESTDHRYIGR
jgi:hypothetical protein